MTAHLQRPDVLVVVAWTLRFMGGGDTLPSSVASRFKDGGILELFHLTVLLGEGRDTLFLEKHGRHAEKCHRIGSLRQFL